ncbi:hypothetical protein [Caenispirillum bisanense]|uniref:hypothetical protein n=1 Tax=Caenispirillum bisanense TaxID=414052 RepID=UPI0031DCD652
MFDLHKAFERKQEYECGRLDAFLFRHRARTIRLIAEWVAAERAEGTGLPLDPQALAAEVATATDADLLDRLAALHGADDPAARRRFDRHCARLRAEAYRQLVAEYGDPTPHQLV